MWRLAAVLVLAIYVVNGCAGRETPSHSVIEDLPQGPAAKYFLRTQADQRDKGQGYEISSPEGLHAVEKWLQDNAKAVKESQVLPNLALIPAPGSAYYSFYQILEDGAVVPIPLMTKVPYPQRTHHAFPDEWIPNLSDAEMQRLNSLFEKYGTLTDWDPDPRRYSPASQPG